MRKLLQNPFVVAVLALAAVYLVLNSLGIDPLASTLRGSQGDSSHTTSQPSESPPISSSSKVEVSQPVNEGVTEEAATNAPNPAMDLIGWFGDQARNMDPFRRPTVEQEDEKTRAADVLTLQAIWNQPASRLVVINYKLLREGDEIEDFKVLSIEKRQIWVEGPNGREPLKVEYKPRVTTEDESLGNG